MTHTSYFYYSKSPLELFSKLLFSEMDADIVFADSINLRV